MPNRSASPERPREVPIELAVKWVAWNADHTRVVAHAETLRMVWRATREMGIDDPVFEKIPRSDASFFGAR